MKKVATKAVRRVWYDIKAKMLAATEVKIKRLKLNSLVLKGIAKDQAHSHMWKNFFPTPFLFPIQISLPALFFRSKDGVRVRRILLSGRESSSWLVVSLLLQSSKAPLTREWAI